MSLDKDFDEFIAKRCEYALLNNLDYMDLQKKLVEACKNKDIDAYRELNISMEIIVRNTCYKAALNDKSILLT
jgi:hypothetical protein